MATDDDWDAAASAERVRLVQKVLQGAAPDDADAALVVIPGVDGRYNDNAQRILKYLLLGASGERLLEPTVNAEDEALEDCFFVICRDEVKVFYNVAAAARVAPLIGLWPNLEEFHLLPGEDRSDAARAERFKIASLVRMLRGRRTVVMPTRSEQEDNHEQWPLVQAYGLDEFASGGFMSAVHRVVHAGVALQSLWSHVDAHAMKEARAAPRALLSHWATSQRLVAKQVRDRGEVAIHDAFEPLKGFYDFGSIRRPAGCVKSAFAPGASVRALASLDSAGFVVRGQDASSGIRFARTCFVDADTSAEALRAVAKVRVLVETFQMLLARLHLPTQGGSSTFALLEDPSRPRAVRRLHEMAVALVQNLAATLRVELDVNALSVDLRSFDLAGQDVEAVYLEGTSTPLCALHYLEIKLPLGAPSAKDAEPEALVIGETFAMPAARGAPVEVLTGDMTRFLAWSTAAPNEEAFALKVEDLGTPLKGRRRTPCELAFAGAAGLVLEGHMQLYAKGFVFEHAAFGRMAINLGGPPRRMTQWAQAPPRCAMVSIENVNLDGTSEVPLPDAALREYLGHGTSALGLLVFEHSELSDALHAWRQTIETLEFCIEDLAADPHSGVAREFAGSRMYNLLMAGVDGMPEDSSSGDLVEEEKRSASTTSTTTTRAPVLIVTGPPGGGKASVARAIAAQLQGSLVECDPFLFGNGFEADRFRKLVDKAEAASGLRPLVVVTPGDTWPGAALDAIKGAGSTRPISVVAVVSARHSFRDARMTNLLPGVQAQVAPGLVQSIVVTGVGLVSDAASDRVQARLRLWNPRAEIFCVDGPCVPRVAEAHLPQGFWSHQSAVLSRRLTDVTAGPQRYAWDHHELTSAVVFSTNAVVDRHAMQRLLERLTTKASALEEASENRIPNDSSSPSPAAKVAGDVVCVSGHATFGSGACMAVCAINGAVYMAPAGSPGKRTLGLLFEGFGVAHAAETLEGLVAATAAKEQPLLSAKDLSPATLAAIDASLLSTPPPAGSWFDGRNYVDASGNLLKHHPLFTARVEAELETKNASIREVNQSIAARGSAVFSSF